MTGAGVVRPAWERAGGGASGAWVPHGRFVVEGAPSGPLAGLTFAAKDLFDVAGHVTGAGNPTWLATHAPATQHADAVQALLDAGATLHGKVVTDELAFSLHGDNVHYGAPRNAAAPDRVTGGSSSGSAAAVGAGCVDFALGTDTGGSTRVPASYGGLWGLRTTHGLVSARGVVPLAPHHDTVTWLARDPTVFARVGEVLLPASSYVPRRVWNWADAIVLADEAFFEPLHAVAVALQQRLGVKMETTRVADGQPLEGWRRVYATVSSAESGRLHADWIRREQPVFGPAIAARFAAAMAITPEAAAAAGSAAAAIRARVRALIGDDGIAVLPSAASVAPRRDADPADVDAVRLRTMAITCIAGLAGLPQVSLPVGTDPATGAPIGISLVGPAGSDRALIALAVELATERAASSPP